MMRRHEIANLDYKRVVGFIDDIQKISNSIVHERALLAMLNEFEECITSADGTNLIKILDQQ